MHFRLAHDIVLLVYSVSISFSCILVRLVSLPVALEQYDYDNPALSPIVCSRRKNSLRMTALLAVRRLDLTDATVKFLRWDHMPTFPLHTALIRPRISSANSSRYCLPCTGFFRVRHSRLFSTFAVLRSTISHSLL